MKSFQKWNTKLAERRECLMNLKLLSDRVSEAGITQAELAKRAGISAASMSRKMRGKTLFNTKEAETICEILGIMDSSDKVKIFLS